MPTKAFSIRDYRPDDAEAVNSLAAAAFAQFEQDMDDWEQAYEMWSNMSALAEDGHIVVATREREILGAVCYQSPGSLRLACFDAGWPLLRSMTVHPSARRQGIGRALLIRCFELAEEEGSTMIALLTSPMMQEAVALYEGIGFQKHAEAGCHNGVAWTVYTRQLRVNRRRS